MKVRVHFTDTAMSIFVISGIGTIKVGDQHLRDVDVSARKADMFRRIFRENEEYDLERFFLVLTNLKTVKLIGLMSNGWVNNFVSRLREDLGSEYGIESEGVLMRDSKVRRTE